VPYITHHATVKGDDAMTTDEDIVQRYLNADGSLRQMPAKRGPRLLLLAHIAGRIPVDVELKEAAVNDALRPVSSDVAMLRRALVDEGLVERWPPGVYRRRLGPPFAEPSDEGDAY
jgi:hypothetical protein